MSAKAATLEDQAKLTQNLKICPPHKWKHVETKWVDEEGNESTTWKMVCDRCGPLKPLGSVDRTGL